MKKLRLILMVTAVMTLALFNGRSPADSDFSAETSSHRPDLAFILEQIRLRQSQSGEVLSSGAKLEQGEDAVAFTNELELKSDSEGQLNPTSPAPATPPVLHEQVVKNGRCPYLRN